MKQNFNLSMGSDSESTIYKCAVERVSTSSEESNLIDTSEELLRGDEDFIDSNEDNDDNSEIFLNIDQQKAKTRIQIEEVGTVVRNKTKTPGRVAVII